MIWQWFLKLVLIAILIHPQLITIKAEDSFIPDFGALEELRKSSPYFNKTTPDFIRFQGFFVESHEIHTEDGYILTLHRIPYGKDQNERQNKSLLKQLQPVLLQHGFLCTSSDWVMQSSEKALPYKLADTGLYDVWLGNIRGNKYSQRHETLSPEEDAFWNFSYHEAGRFDIKAMVEYILKETKHQQIYYIAHSMGNNMIYALLSENPEYNSKIKLVISLAPAPFLNHMKSPLKSLSPLATVNNLVYDTFGPRELTLSSFKKVLSSIGPPNCARTASEGKVICNEFFALMGLDVNSLNQTWMPIIFSQYPDISSTKTLIHFLQGIHTGSFSLFNYGHAINRQLYNGISHPPDYDLSKVIARVAIWKSIDDVLVDTEDVEKLVSRLPNVVVNQNVEATSFNHAGFLYGKYADILVYDKIIKLMKSYY